MTSWTQQCIRHADVLLVFASAQESHAVTGFEERVEAASLRVTKELVLCHTENTRYADPDTRVVNYGLDNSTFDVVSNRRDICSSWDLVG